MSHEEQLSLLDLLETSTFPAAEAPAAEVPASNHSPEPFPRASRRPLAESAQRTFGSLVADPGWASVQPLPFAIVSLDLTPHVRKQTAEYERQLVVRTMTTPESARTQLKALECLAKQGQRVLGRPLDDLAELYEVDMIAALARDDAPIDPALVQLRRSTCRQRRGMFLQYLRAVGVPGLTFKQGAELVKEGFRKAARRKGYRYELGTGYVAQEDVYLPPSEDVERFLKTTERYGRSFAGARLAAVTVLVLGHGLRPVSLLSISGKDFRWKGRRLYLVVREKRVKGKRERRELEVRPWVIPYLEKLVAAVNRGTPWRSDMTAIGSGEPFFLDLTGKALTYEALLRDFGECCQLAGVKHFTARNLRHLYASGLAVVLPLHEGAIAGGWKNDGVYTRHYVESLRDWQLELALDQPDINLDDDLPVAWREKTQSQEEAMDARRSV